jgi:hypothetical protein
MRYKKVKIDRTDGIDYSVKMKFKNCILLCIAAVLLFSCVKKKENIGLDEQINDDLIEAAEEKEREAMKEFIYENDYFFEERDAEIDFIEKANFGIPGGDNWIVRLNSLHIFIYVINGGRIEEEYHATVSGQHFFDQYPEEVSEYDIMRGIPGTHIPDGCVSFGDFNGDGTDELFRYLYAEELGHNVDFFHYEPQRKGFVLCRIRFKIIDQEKGPAPVVFTTYRGMKGFKVYYSNIESWWVSEPNPAPDPRNDKWIFYSWNEEQRKYVEIGEVVP